MSDPFDAIVVGGRCAGAPTAMLLARRGWRVLLVDRAASSSDTVSTLVIHAPGVAALARWGLLDEVVATGCPPIQRYTFDLGEVVISGTPHAVDGIDTGYAPRRTELDPILVRAAARAGVEVREQFTVEEVLVEEGTVIGVSGREADGRCVTERARVVIGADGWNSTVARAVGAERYHAHPVLANTFYSYWRDLPTDDMRVIIRDDQGMSIIPTNDDLTLVLVTCLFERAAEFRRDAEASYRTAIGFDPRFADEARSATRIGPVVGGGVPNFFRKPYGPGWALVGDAGYTKDPVLGQGISDAFIGAEACTAALADVFEEGRPFDEVMSGWQRGRDEAALPLYELTTQLAALEPTPPELEELLVAVAGRQAAMDAFVSVTAGVLSPAVFFDPDHLAAILS